MGMNAALEAICARLRASFTALKTCETHPGRFDEDELKRISGRAPAMYAACLGVPRFENPGTEQADEDALWGIFCVTGNAPDLTRDEAARNLAEAVALLVQNERWGLAHTGEAREIKAENLYSGKLSSAGTAIWAVVWRQKIRLGDSVWDGEGVFPSHLYVGLSPDIGEAHIDDYVEVTGE